MVKNENKVNSVNKFVAIKESWIFDKGTIVELKGVDDNNIVSFTFNDGKSNGFMDTNTFKEYFKLVENKPSVDESGCEVNYDDVCDIIEKSNFEIKVVDDDIVVIYGKLPNGFTFVESFYCQSAHEKIDEDFVYDIYNNKIVDKIFELESYRIKEENYRNNCRKCCENKFCE